jgi:hypothetical protein
LAGTVAAILQRCIRRRFQMRRHPLLTIAIVLPLVTAAASCGRKSTAPEAQQTTGVQPRSDPTSVTGCLRAGAAEDTFVLTTTAPDSPNAATYNLNANAEVNLRQYVGQRVEVGGVVRSEQQVTSSSGATPEKAAKGTSGTPTVETKTALDVRQIDVRSVRATGEKCQ